MEPDCITYLLAHKAPITTVADDIHKYFYIVFQRKLNLMFQVIQIKPYFLRKIKVKCRLLQFLFIALKIYSLVDNIKNDLVKYFMQHVRNGLTIHFFTNSFRNNIC